MEFRRVILVMNFRVKVAVITSFKWERWDLVDFVIRR